MILHIAIAAAVIALVWWVVIRWANKPRPHDTAQMREWSAWYAKLPKPSDAKYNDWRCGGAEMYEADRMRYIAEHGSEPIVKSLN